ncbi:MAG: tRNA pseudouridine(38-40) synthase TruA [Candidatus Binatia bacterium]|nr:tRNA pseudouridine(38-40) synthase TruA [Candidatus Binatia bacterium]
MSNHKFTVRYDGREFSGWQRHQNKATIQGAIEEALSGVFGSPVAIFGSGRTDGGAHAQGQVFNADLPGEPDLAETKRALDLALVPAVRILDIEQADEGFHARTASIGKIYRYEIWNAPKCPGQMKGRVWHIPGPLAVDPMRAACAELVGERDFATFATKTNYKQKSTRRNLKRVTLSHDLERISIVFEADGFLYKMVRNLVRAIVKVGEGRTKPEDLRALLAACDRKVAPGTAPASGLFLDAVQYE